MTAPCRIELRRPGLILGRMNPSPGEIRLLNLVEHGEHIDSETPLAAAQIEFARRKRRFLGVTSRGLFAGVAAGQHVTELLSLQFGRSLFGRAPISQHTMRDALVILPSTPLTELLQLTAARDEESFYHDIALVSEQREFLGLIPIHRLVRLQTTLLLANLAEVEEQRRELANRNQRMEEDLRMAREVQLALLPGQPVRMRYGGRILRTQHVYEPADVIGGDLFTVFPAGDGVLACCICDVMGHGVRPALITAILRSLVQESHPSASDPGAMLTEVNCALQSVLRSVGDLIFVTAGYAVIDLVRSELRYSQAGHPGPLLWRGDRRVVGQLVLGVDVAGPALGLLEDFRFATTVVDFGPGDALLLYTDGVFEVAAPDGFEFGADRLRAGFAAAIEQGRPDIAQAVVESARRFAGGGAFPDDVCVLAAHCCETTETGG